LLNVVPAAGLVGKVARRWGSSGHFWYLSGLFLDVTDDPVDDDMLCDDGDDLHFGAALAEEWVYLEDFSDQSCPGSSTR